MEVILQKIKSKYIYQNILDYIKNKDYKYILFKYSKLFQNKLSIELDDYKIRYINKINLIIIHNYITFENTNKDEFDKNILIKNLEYDLQKYKDIFDFKTLQKYVINYFRTNSFSHRYLSIYSPFFDTLLINENLGNFIIPIKISIIEKYNLENDYISSFNKINSLNLNYPDIELEYKDEKDIDYLPKLNINFNKVKRLVLTKENYDDNSYDYFFKNLFLLNNIQNNLIIFEMESNSMTNYININGNSFKFINTILFLEKLNLKNIIFENTFILELYRLKNVSLIRCENITFDENNIFNLKILKIDMGVVIEPGLPIKFPKLENCYLFRNFNYMQEEYDKIIDFKSLINLKKLTKEFKEFKNIEHLSSLISLEELKLKDAHLIDEEYIKQIISFQNLKFLDIKIKKIDYNEIKKVKLKNYSLIKFNIDWYCDNNDCKIDIIQEKFPNLTNFAINFASKEKEPIIIEIKENKDYKVDKFKLFGKINKKLSFICTNFENLKEIQIHSENKLRYIKEFLPIFQDKSNVLFKSLNTFSFSYTENYVDLLFLNSVYNNIDNMPNVKYFELICFSQDISESFLKNFIRKLLSINLDTCIIKIQKIISNKWIKKLLYPKKELQEICPNNKNIYLYDAIYIEKIEDNLYKGIDDFEFV